MAISPVPLERVVLAEGFLRRYAEEVAQKVVLACLEHCEETGRIRNFEIAAGRERGEFRGRRYDDSDVLKTVEGAALLLAKDRDPLLEGRVAAIVERIGAAQGDDGYLDTYFTLVAPERRWRDLAHGHELYCAGHLVLAGLAWRRATGREDLLRTALRMVDHVAERFGPGRREEPPGHPGIELALLALARATGEGRHADLARFFLEARGRPGREGYGEYAQDHRPARDQREAVGHAVRATYMYAAMAELAADDPSWLEALLPIWRDVTETKMYVTGGVGSSAANEGFGASFDLPNDSAYAETCAAIGTALWAHRMFLATGEARFADTMERVLLNAVLVGVSARGDRFFYDNPLGTRGNHRRASWFDCACCPTNLARFLPAIPELVYAFGEREVFVLLYAAGEAEIPLPGGDVGVCQETAWPWSGEVVIRIDAGAPQAFALCLRVPSFCSGPPPVRVNGAPAEAEVAKGFLRLDRTWAPGDEVSLTLPIAVRRVRPDPRVTACLGRVALARGPVVYCLEGADHEGYVRNLVLPPAAEVVPGDRPDPLGGAVVLYSLGLAVHEGEGRRRAMPAPLTAVPYALWGNREPGEMVVWIPEVPALAELPGEVSCGVRDGVRIRASHCFHRDGLACLRDGRRPSRSDDPQAPRMSFRDHRGTREWIRYDYPAPREVDRAEVYFSVDGDEGGCRPPRAWRLLRQKEDRWIPVELGAGEEYGTAPDRPNAVRFSPVVTRSVMLELKLREGFSAGLFAFVLGPRP